MVLVVRGVAVTFVVVVVEEVWDGGDERERERPGSRVREREIE